MRTLIIGLLCYLFLSVGSTDYHRLWNAFPVAQAASLYYVSPYGSGSSCTKTSPCSLTTGLDKAQAGDEVVLMDGTYTQMLQSRRSGAEGRPITIRAENRHQAVFRIGNGNITQFDHSYLTIRGIKFDALKTGGPNGGIRFMPYTHHIIFEHNIAVNFATSCLHMAGDLGAIHDIIIRHNTVEDCGNQEWWGEAMYTGGKSDPNNYVYNVQMYGNTFRNFTQNGLDSHDRLDNMDFHHNILSDQKPSIEKCGSGCSRAINGNTNGTWNHGAISVYVGGQYRNKIHNNILFNNKGGFGVFWLTSRNQTVTGNVAYGNLGSMDDLVKYQYGGSNGPKTEFAYNTFCNLPSYNIQNAGEYNIHDNRINAPQSACDAEVARIMNEMKQLPGADGQTTPTPQSKPPTNLRIIGPSGAQLPSTP